MLNVSSNFGTRLWIDGFLGHPLANPHDMATFWVAAVHIDDEFSIFTGVTLDILNKLLVPIKTCSGERLKQMLEKCRWRDAGDRTRTLNLGNFRG